MAERRPASPPVNVESESYYEAMASGVLQLGRCRKCGETHHYPRAICPVCFSDEVERTAARGTGKIYTYSVLRRGAQIPYAIAYVLLEEGVKILTNIVECDVDRLTIGQDVRLAPRPAEDGTIVPMFKPY